MPTYAQLASEPVWGAQFIPPVMNAGLLGPLRAFYGLGPSAIGSAGDNNHLYGRHRSYDWDATSRYCINRSYGTTDSRDQGGNRNWYRAVDVGIQGQLLFDASHRMDALARSGACPGLAEWFGTFDGVNVVGWFEGRPASSDSSHLFHLHVGVWNSFANSAATITQLYATITGTEEQDMDGVQDAKLTETWQRVAAIDNRVKQALLRGVPTMQDIPGDGADQPVNIIRKIDQILAKLATPVPVEVNADAVADALATNEEFLAALAKAVNDDAARRLED